MLRNCRPTPCQKPRSAELDRPGAMAAAAPQTPGQPQQIAGHAPSRMAQRSAGSATTSEPTPAAHSVNSRPQPTGTAHDEAQRPAQAKVGRQRGRQRGVGPGREAAGRGQHQQGAEFGSRSWLSRLPGAGPTWGRFMLVGIACRIMQDTLSFRAIHSHTDRGSPKNCMVQVIHTRTCSTRCILRLSAPALTRTAAQPLAEQLAARFADRIRDRLLAAGCALPSVRQCAAQHGLNPSTVVAAYDLLLAQGLVEAQRNRGFFVRDRAPRAAAPWRTPSSAAPEAGAHGGAGECRGPDPRHVPSGRAPAAARHGRVPGRLDGLHFLQSAVRRVTATETLADSLAALRRAAGRRPPAPRAGDPTVGLGLPAGPDQIITTVGATHALDIVSRTLLKPGDGVMVEEPGWAVEFARLAAMGMRMLPVPRGPAGPDLAVMARYCEAHAPKLFVSVSVLHNPTGYCLSPASAHRVLQLAQQHEFPRGGGRHLQPHCARARHPHVRARRPAAQLLRERLRQNPGAQLAGGLPGGAADWVERLLDTKLLTTLTTPSLLERALAHLHRTRASCGATPSASATGSTRRAAAACGWREAAGCRFVAEPAGLFGWVDTGVDTEALAQRLLDEGYLIAPGCPVPRGAGAEHPHAHQLRHHAGRRVLGRLPPRAGWQHTRRGLSSARGERSVREQVGFAALCHARQGSVRFPRFGLHQRQGAFEQAPVRCPCRQLQPLGQSCPALGGHAAQRSFEAMGMGHCRLAVARSSAGAAPACARPGPAAWPGQFLQANPRHHPGGAAACPRRAKAGHAPRSDVRARALRRTGRWGRLRPRPGPARGPSPASGPAGSPAWPCIAVHARRPGRPPGRPAWRWPSPPRWACGCSRRRDSSSRMARVASSPLMPGICTSIKTRSTPPCSHWLTACAPPRATRTVKPSLQQHLAHHEFVDRVVLGQQHHPARIARPGQRHAFSARPAHWRARRRPRPHPAAAAPG
jgi:DNA-binding transcriptional MocR family regulator